MSTFDKREDSFEKSYVYDKELQFKAEARRNKMLGLWAAGKLGKSEADARSYADSLVAAETAANAAEIVLERVLNDFAAAGVEKSEHQVKRTMDEFLASALADIKAGR